MAYTNNYLSLTMALLMLYNRQRTQITSNQGGKEIISTTNRKRGDWWVRDGNAANVESSYGPINRIVLTFRTSHEKEVCGKEVGMIEEMRLALDNVELL